MRQFEVTWYGEHDEERKEIVTAVDAFAAVSIIIQKYGLDDGDYFEWIEK